MLHRFEIHSALKLSRTALLCCRLFARLLIGNKSRKLGLEQKRGMKLGKREKSPPFPSPFPLQSSSFFRFRSNFLACVAQALSPPQRLQLGGGKRPLFSLLSSPFPSSPAHSLFLSHQPPHNTKRPLRRREAQATTFVDFLEVTSWKSLLSAGYDNTSFKIRPPRSPRGSWPTRPQVSEPSKKKDI